MGGLLDAVLSSGLLFLSAACAFLAYVVYKFKNGK